MEVHYIIIMLLGVLFVFLFVNEINTLKRSNNYLEQEVSVHYRNSVTLMRLIHNLFFERELDLISLSKLSREFFSEEDIILYGWSKETPYSNEKFFEVEEKGPRLIVNPKGVPPNEIFSEKVVEEWNRDAIEDWEYFEQDDNKRLMEARRDFFIKNFVSKMNSLSGKYHLVDFRDNKSKLDDNISLFIARFSNLINKG